MRADGDRPAPGGAAGRPPVLDPAQRDRTRRSREALLDGGLLVVPPGAAGVPQLIERSWRRCVGEQVPVGPATIGYREPEDVSPALFRAAEPVLARLRDSFADVPVAMVLSDATGRIVVRHVEVRRQRDAMDRAYAAEGFDFSERSIGTNGLGTVLVERRPVLVRGPEHYHPLLEDLTCAGTPIVEPGTGRLLGSFSLACSVRDVHPLMTVLAGDIGRQIEARVAEEGGQRRRRLVDAYLAVERAGTAALVVDEDTVLANGAGLAHSGPELHPVLWPFLAEHARPGVARMRVPLADGPHDAVVERLDDGGPPAYCVRLLPGRRPADDPAPARVLTGPVPAPLHPDPAVAGALHTALDLGERVALAGAAGTGKAHTARRVLARLGAGDPLVLDAGADPDWTGARGALAQGRGLLVRRLQQLPAAALPQLRRLAETPGPLAFTVDRAGADDGVLGLLGGVATTVELPALARCRDRLPVLVREILAGLPDPERGTRFAPATWDRLLAWHWPGEVAELATTVIALARRARGGVVEPVDLPAALAGPGRAPSGLLASAERSAVAEALRAAGGNRSRAAAALGIGRTTLYRKIREFGLG